MAIPGHAAPAVPPVETWTSEETVVRVVVCAKDVPDAGGRRFDADGRVHRDVDDGTLDPLDEHALEAARALVDRCGGEVIVLVMGPSQARRTARAGLLRGADRAVHVSDRSLEGSDAFTTASVLAAAVRETARDGAVDLVLMGSASSDAGTSVLPVLLAAELDWAGATHAAQLGVSDGRVRVRRAQGAVDEVVEAPLPAVVSVTDLLNDPCVPDMAAIRAARTRPLTTWTLDDVGVPASAVGRAGARTRVLETAPRTTPSDRVLLTDDGTAGIRLAELLLENGLA